MTPMFQQPSYEGVPTLLPSFPWSQQELHEVASPPSTEGKPRLGAGPRVHTEPQSLPHTQALLERAVKPGQEGWAACLPAAAPHSEHRGLGQPPPVSGSGPRTRATQGGARLSGAQGDAHEGRLCREHCNHSSYRTRTRHVSTRVV